MNLSEQLIEAAKYIPADWKMLDSTKMRAEIAEDFSVLLKTDIDKRGSVEMRFEMNLRGRSISWPIQITTQTNASSLLQQYWDRAIYGLIIQPATSDLSTDLSYLSNFPKWVKEDIGLRWTILGWESYDVRAKIKVIPDINERFVYHSKWLSQIQRALYYCSTDPKVRGVLPGREDHPTPMPPPMRY